MSTLTDVAVERRRLFGRGLGALLRSETTLFLRDPGNLFFALVFPTVVLIGVGFAIPGMLDPIEDAGPTQGMLAIVVMVPPVLATAMATPALTTLPVIFATYREQGILKRLSTTPMRPQAMLVTHVIIGVVSFLVATAIAVIAAALAFDVMMPENLPITLISGVLCAASMFGIGLLIAAVAPKGSTAQAIGMTLFFPLLFFAGLWTPEPIMPEIIKTVATWTPLGAGSQALNEGWFSGGVPTTQLAVMAGYIAVTYPLAAKLFRWK